MEKISTYRPRNAVFADNYHCTVYNILDIVVPSFMSISVIIESTASNAMPWAGRPNSVVTLQYSWHSQRYSILTGSHFQHWRRHTAKERCSPIDLSFWNQLISRLPMIKVCRKPWKFVLTSSSYSKLLLGLIYSCSWLVVRSSFHVNFCRLYVCYLSLLARCLSAFRSWILGSLPGVWCWCTC